MAIHPKFLEPGKLPLVPFMLASSTIPGFKEFTGIPTFSSQTGHEEKFHALLRLGISKTVGERFIPSGFQPKLWKEQRAMQAGSPFAGALGPPAGYRDARTGPSSRFGGSRETLARIRARRTSGGIPPGIFGGESRQRSTAGRERGREINALREQASATGMPGMVQTNQWQTFPGGPVFRRFDGVGGTRIAVTRADGTIKVYRPYKPVVIPKKWNSRSMGRVARALKGQQKMAIAIVKMTGGDASTTKRARQATPAHGHRTIVEAT